MDKILTAHPDETEQSAQENFAITQTVQSPASDFWSVEDAQALRRQAISRLATKHRWIAPIAWLPVKWAMSFGHSVLRRPVYQHRLQQLSTRMNQHADTAFDGYTPVANDVITAGSFKAGTYLLMHICYQISERGEGQFDHIQDVLPWPDAAEPKFWRSLFDQSAYASRTGRRVIKTNLPATKVPINDCAKYIAVTRDPKDCAASGFYYFRSLILGPTAPPPAMWLDHMASKEAPFGRWDVFTASWYAIREKPNVLFLRYESMKNNPVDTVTAIAEFLDIDLTDAAVEKIVQKTSFTEMKEMNSRFFPATQSMWTNNNDSIVRKGQSGDGIALFDPEHLQAFDAEMEAGLNALGSDFPYANNYSIDKDTH